MMLRKPLVAIALGALGTLACASNPPPESQQPTTTGASTREYPSEQPAQTQPMQQGPSTVQTAPTQPENPFTTDAQIAGYVGAANKATIEQAKVALQRAKSSEVKAFARYMIKQHGDAEASQKKLLSTMNITPVENATTTQLTSDAQSATTSLKAKTGSEFDKAYIDLMVSEHKAVIDTLDKQLMPAVKDASLKDELGKMKPELEEHLRRAEALQQKMTKM
jgi:putative membrane protein